MLVKGGGGGEGIGGQFPSEMTSLPGRLSKEIKPAGDLFTSRTKGWMKKAREREKKKEKASGEILCTTHLM